jgi:succinate dehydrogenase / fumarate reductase flavoprotein subunit
MNEYQEGKVNIIGSGLAGLMASITLAGKGVKSRLFSVQASERAQSVMAEGGINGALNTTGEDDSPEDHFQDTMRAGCDIADPEAVRGLTQAAPHILEMLRDLGVPFNQNADGTIMQRNFGGQKKKRTAYAKSSTGKIIMTALIDEARRYEAKGLIERFSSHELIRLLLCNGKTVGAAVKNTYTGEEMAVRGPVILACGGMNGMFPGRTTGTTANSGDAAAIVFSQGVIFSNLEMIQYHPTTIGIPGKRCLVSEAARGEGGRLYIERDGKPWYFMEEKYPELGNLMPRDVVSREMYAVLHDESLGDQVYLDLTGLSKETWKKKLPDLRQEIIDYLNIDPARVPVPVEPGIHYFMGGIDVDVKHRTNIKNLYAAGECCSQYHGANRLGGNSLLGAIYGGMTAADTLLQDESLTENLCDEAEWHGCVSEIDETACSCIHATPEIVAKTADILYHALGIVREESTMQRALDEIKKLILENQDHPNDLPRLYLAEAMLSSAISRRESRGAHYRSDFPQRDEKYQRTMRIQCPARRELSSFTHCE